MSPNSTPVNEGLKREIGVTDIAASVINLTVGSGIFLMPALVAAILGNASIIAYILCGLLYFCIILCFAEMSSRFSNSGGAYIYIEKAFGPFAGFIANNLFWFSGVLMCSAMANGIADMLSVPYPIFTQLFYRILLFIVLIGFVTWSNITGVKRGMKVVKLLTAIKLIPLLLIVIVGFSKFNLHNITWSAWPTSNTIGIASLLLFGAFLGGETAATLGGEMKDSSKTGPKGLILGVAAVIIFYILIHLAAQSSLGASLATQNAPLAAVAGSLMGSVALKLLLVCGIIALFGTLYSGVMAFSRILFAGAFNGLLPKYLEKVHPKYATPYLSIITLSTIAFILACTGGYRQLMVVGTISMMILFVGVVLALIKFRLSGDKNEVVTGFRIPGGIIIPVIALVALIWFLSHSTRNEIIGICCFVAVLILIYLTRYLATKRPVVHEI